MRLLALILAALPLPAMAWEFSPVPICTLTHAEPEAEVTVTYDAALPEYAISITLADGVWAAGPLFAITFQGPMGLTITTNRHTLSDDGATLTVRDRGFGNVLNGLEFNASALAQSGATAIRIPLEGAAPEVRAFRGCPSPVTS